MTSYEEFASQANTANVVPLIETMLADMHTPVSTYLTLRDGGAPSFLFESAEPNERIGRYSFIGAGPAVIVRAKGEECEISDRTGTKRIPGTIFEAMKEQLAKFHQAPVAGLEGFLGGFVGYLGYDTVRHLERLPVTHLESDGDDAVFGLFPSFVRFDHREQRITVVHNVLLDASRPRREQFEEGRKAVETMVLRLRRSVVPAHAFSCSLSPHDFESDRESFCQAVTRAKEYIHEGDIFQVVLSRRMELTYAGDLFAVYRALRVVNPSPYLFYLDFGSTKMAGSSPEVLVRVRNSTVEVFPIAGTRKRGATSEEDESLEAELLRDQKELAEHIMLVDLGRNDVGRISEFGSVRVPVLKRVERYSHVMHLVSEVHGTLKREYTALDALKACFPAGTVSGAPKVRAMEIIDELEPCPRGTYAGAVGYLGLNGALDTCIAIRTIVAHHDRLRVQAGAGIVADSVPDQEYRETANKAGALLDALRLAAAGLAPTLPRERAGKEYAMILVLDNYDSFTFNLVQLLGKYRQDIVVKRNDEIRIDEVIAMRPDGILISPGPGRPEDAGIALDLIRACGEQIPILGVCLGHQAIGLAFGGMVVHAPALMHGRTSEIHHDQKGIYCGLPTPFTATRYHSLVISATSVPAVLQVTARTPDGIIMGVRHQTYPIEGVQFHPESILTESGEQIIRNWLQVQK